MRWAKAMAGLDVVLMGGFALGVVALTGCGSSGNSGGGGGGTPNGLAAGGAKDIFVVQGYEFGPVNTILEFSADSSQVATPKGTLVVPAALSAESVATDSTGQIYVGGILSGQPLLNEILVYAAGATGNATPVRTIVLNDFNPIHTVVDSAGVIYAAGAGSSGGSVAVIAAGANGMTTPERVLTSAEFTGPVGIAVDTAGEIFIANEMYEGPAQDYIGGDILVFAAGANGAVTPSRVIEGPTPTATANYAFVGIAVDGPGNITTVFDTTTFNSGNLETGTSAVVEEFAAGASGAATPTKTVGGAASGLTLGSALRVDGVGNIYVINEANALTTPAYSVLGFAPTATGNVAPGLTLASSSWTDSGIEFAVQ